MTSNQLATLHGILMRYTKRQREWIGIACKDPAIYNAQISAINEVENAYNLLCTELRTRLLNPGDQQP